MHGILLYCCFPLHVGPLTAELVENTAILGVQSVALQQKATTTRKKATYCVKNFIVFCMENDTLVFLL